MKIQLDMYQTMAVAVAVLMLGSYLRKKIDILHRRLKKHNLNKNYLWFKPKKKKKRYHQQVLLGQWLTE